MFCTASHLLPTGKIEASKRGRFCSRVLRCIHRRFWRLCDIHLSVKTVPGIGDTFMTMILQELASVKRRDVGALPYDSENSVRADHDAAQGVDG